ncbi:MAG: hypothetical protein EHM71_14140 [Zetaproteobacteria bacterium]|nr:MAG: hypothetical protein EHM71_14140 [Zetaproteobacteria bacterium]
MAWTLTRDGIGVWVAVLVAAVCSGCGATTATSPIDSYPFAQTLGQIKVAADPFFTKERARAEFPGGEAFEEGGLLAIQVGIENGTSQTVRANPADFRLVRGDGRSEASLSPQDAFSTVKPPVGWWAVLPILGPSASALRNVDWLKHFESRALKDIPIGPGGSAVGLVYFYFPEADKDLAGTRVAFAVRAESGEERRFDIALAGRRDILGGGVRVDPAAPVSRPPQTQSGGTRIEGAGGGVIIRSPAP